MISHKNHPSEPKRLTPELMAEGAGETAPPVDYYDGPSKQFLIKNASHRWLPHDLSSYTRHLRARGFRSRKIEGETLSETDLAILDVQNYRDVAYHGPICGRNAGLIEENGMRLLVTEDMKLPGPVKGEFSTLRAVLEGLFFANESEQIGAAQFHTFCGWIKSSVEALREGREQQQQALAICGVAGCGKSLLQHLITDMLGGRSAKALRYFNGKTPFNADLFTAEHLILEDDHTSVKISERQKLGASLKEHCVGVTTASLHAKGRTAVNIRPWWRVTITLNDDPEAMMILPPLDDHVADKIIILKASLFEFPMPVSSTVEKAVFRQKLVSEIPAFLHWLLNDYEIPHEYADPRRYNVATYHHPVLKESLEALSPESDLLDFIDLGFADEFRRNETVELSASAVDSRLRGINERRLDRIVTFRQGLGSYLGRLSKKRPKRVSYHRSENSRIWRLHPPTNA